MERGVRSGSGTGGDWHPVAALSAGLISIHQEHVESLMAKLKLDLDAIRVETFEAAPPLVLDLEIPVTLPSDHRLGCCQY